LTLEVKRRLTGDLGDLSGCALDFAFTVPVNSRVVQETVGRLFPVYRDMCYTGFGDANVTIARDGVWFFEKCERFGYNAHPNLLWNLSRTPLGETFAGLLDGSFDPDFAEGFGASCTIYMDHPAAGKVIHFPESIARHLYLMDIYKEGDQLLTAGYNELVAIAHGWGHTIAEAWEQCVAHAWQVKFSGRAFRIDGADTTYPSSPLRRYEALKALGYI
jgi:hypothetical protein